MAKPTRWVVYRMALLGGHPGHNAVCSQAEWEALERDRPGRHTLIQAGIDNEGQAERLARSLQSPPETPKPPPRW